MQNKIKFTFGIVFLLSVFFYGCNCKDEGRQFESAQRTENGLIIKTNDGDIHLTARSNYAVEVEYIVSGEGSAPSYGMDENNHSVGGIFTENRTEVLYSTPYLTVKINKCPFNISYLYRGKLLVSEEKGFFNNDTLKGFRMNLLPEEKLMGGGERVLGMDRRGNRLHLYNKASYGYEIYADLMYYSLPIVISSKKYMLLFDNAADGYLDLGATEENILQFEAVGGRMSYVVVAGDRWQELTENYTKVTGYQPMPPRWALGNITSRMGYHSQKQVEEVVDLYLKEDFPLDALVLDLYWFGPDLKGHMGNLEWDKKAFPEPEKMIQNIKNKGVKTVLITEPFILKNSGKYQECANQNLLGTDSIGEPYIFDFYFGTTALLDIFKPKTQEWFWDIYKRHTLSGVEGWWGDLGEPEVHPDELQHVNGAANHVHNAYGHEWAKTIYEGFAKDFPNKRPVILMRAGFAGSQRYGMIPWSGDVSRSWGGLKPQVEIALQMGMQGLAYMHSDLGGFAGAYEDAELYTRWLQYGVFQPVYRTHAQDDVPPEPIYWDEQTKRITRKYIKLRYALTPYLYTMAYQNTTKGTPLMRPLFYVDNNPDLLNEKATYLWGDNFLVSPVTDQGAKSWEVTLPKGNNWFNFFTGERYKGGLNMTMPVTINDIPVFVKGGSFIPMVPDFQNMEEYNTNKLILHYYFDEEVGTSTGFMYEDDGETNKSWENNQFEKLVFKSTITEDKGLQLNIVRTGFDYEGKPKERDITLVIHNVQSSPKEVKVHQKDQVSVYHKETKEVSVNLKMTSDNLEILVK